MHGDAPFFIMVCLIFRGGVFPVTVSHIYPSVYIGISAIMPHNWVIHAYIISMYRKLYAIFCLNIFSDKKLCAGKDAEFFVNSHRNSGMSGTQNIGLEQYTCL